MFRSFFYPFLTLVFTASVGFLSSLLIVYGELKVMNSTNYYLTEYAVSSAFYEFFENIEESKTFPQLGYELSVPRTIYGINNKVLDRPYDKEYYELEIQKACRWYGCNAERVIRVMKCGKRWNSRQ